MTTEHAHHVTTLLESGKHARIELGRVCPLHACAVEHHLRVGHGLVVFWQRIVHEGQCRHRLATIGGFGLGTLTPIPCLLALRDPGIAPYPSHGRLAMRVEAVELCPQRFAVSRIHGQHIVEQFATPRGHHTARCLLHQVVERRRRHTLFGVVVAQHEAVGCLLLGEHIEHSLHGKVTGLGIDDVTRNNDEVGLFGFHHLLYALHGRPRGRVAKFIVKIGELHDFELSVVETESLRAHGECREQSKKQTDKWTMVHILTIIWFIHVLQM